MAPSRFAVSRINSATERVSLTGAVFGIQQTAVKPPRAAAIVPLAIVSLSSRPGWRRWTCMSINPGQTTRPVASITRSTLRTDSACFAVFEPFPLPVSVGSPPPASRLPPPVFFSILAIFPSSMSRSRRSSTPLAGSMTRPPLIRIFIIAPSLELSRLPAAGKEIEQGHSNRETVFHLIQDQRTGSVGDIRRDLDPSIDGAGVHDQCIGSGDLQSLGGEAEQSRILPKRGEQPGLLALGLQPEHHDDIDVGNGPIQVRTDLNAEPFNEPRKHRPGPGDSDRKSV